MKENCGYYFFFKCWPSLGDHLFDQNLWSIFQSSLHIRFTDYISSYKMSWKWYDYIMPKAGFEAWSEQGCCLWRLQSHWVVFNCFFAESRQAIYRWIWWKVTTLHSFLFTFTLVKLLLMGHSQPYPYTHNIVENRPTLLLIINWYSLRFHKLIYSSTG